MATQWYLIQGDDNFGPMTSDELKKLAADGKIGRRDLVRKEGTTRWFPATAIEGLLSTPITTPSVPSVKTSSPGSYSPVEPAPPADVKRSLPEPKPEPKSAQTASPDHYRLVEAAPPADVKRTLPEPKPEPEPVQTASPGERSWSGSRWVRLGAESALLTVVIASAAMWIVMPNSSRVQEEADHQPSNPPIAKVAPLARPVPVAKVAPLARPVPVTKVAGPAARGAAGKPMPPPMPAPTTTPFVAVRPRPASSTDYTRLATALSNLYRTADAPWSPDKVTSADVFLAAAGRSSPANGSPPAEQLIGAIQKLKGAHDPVVNEAVARLEAGRQIMIGGSQEANERVERSRQNRNIAAGTVQARERDARPYKESGEFFDSREKLFFANIMAEGAKKGKQVERQAAMETARVDCWNTLVPKLPEIYRGRPEGRDLIQFRITAPDAAARRGPQFAVVNTSRQTLTDVTLVLDLLHYTTAPEPTVFQVFFVPVWQAGAEIRLPTAIAQNRHHGEMSKMRPANADPGPESALRGIHGEWVGADRLNRGGIDPSGSDPAKSWLAGVGGLVAVQASLWSAQANQPVQIFPFPIRHLQATAGNLTSPSGWPAI